MKSRLDRKHSRAEKGWAAMIALLVGAGVIWIFGS